MFVLHSDSLVGCDMEICEIFYLALDIFSGGNKMLMKAWNR